MFELRCTHLSVLRDVLDDQAGRGRFPTDTQVFFMFPGPLLRAAPSQ